MNQLNIAENIVRFRREKKLTQEQLADFVGVTKASVSKWETRQSTPDITILPQLASFFDVTVDELLGYNPQLSKEQIFRLYHEIANDFATLPFEKAMEKCNSLVKQYHNCYSFLKEMCRLWINHFMLAGSQEKQTEILESTVQLCTHIMSNCKDLAICSDAMILKSVVNLQLGKGSEVIDTLEDVVRPERLVTQSDTLLIEAYLLTGDTEKAGGLAQVSMYNHLLALISTATIYLNLHSKDLSVCDETICRIDTLIETYHLEVLNPNTSGVFYYQAALVYAIQGEKQKAIKNLRTCINHMIQLLSKENLTLHGDDYFNAIEAQFAQMGIDENAPRDRKFIVEDIRRLLNNPAFEILEEEPEYHKLKNKLMEVK